MLAPYPLGDDRLEDRKAESNMDCIKSVIHAGRSLRSSYGILPSVRYNGSICVTERFHGKRALRVLKMVMCNLRVKINEVT